MSSQSLHQPTHHSNHESLWCPKCRDYGLVYCDHNDEDLWKCVYCDYQVNLTQGTKRGGNQPWKFPWEVLCAALIVLLFLLFTQDSGLRKSWSGYGNSEQSPVSRVWY